MSSAGEVAFGAALVIAMGCAAPNAAAQADKYPHMAPIGQYLMDRNAEIGLARSAAPASVSRDATVLVLGRQGYETAVEGKNGFVCMVDRSWTAAFDWPEYWNPRVRAAECLNPHAARSIVPIALLRTRMVLAGRSRAEIQSAVKAAFEDGQLPPLESGAMDYMMSKSAYLTDEGGHDAPHVMFFTAGAAVGDSGSMAADSPVMAAPYWFFSSNDPSHVKGLPPILVYLVMVADWSDGTAAGAHDD